MSGRPIPPGSRYSEDGDAEVAAWADFRDPGGRSALRRGRRSFPCPTCKRPGLLSAADVRHGYQCDRCADLAEGGGW